MRILPLLLAGACLAADPAAFLRSGRQAARTGQWAKAESQLLRAEEGARQLDDASLELASRLARVDLRLAADEFDSASALLPALPLRGVAVADSAVWHLARARVALARRSGGDAMTESDIALRLARRADESPLLSAAALVRGRAQLAQGDIKAAESSLRQARSEAGRIGTLQASVAALQARIALARGDAREAARAADRSLALWREAQDVGGVLATLPLRADIDIALGATASALESWNASARIAESSGLPRVAIRSHLRIARLDASAGAGRIERAREILRSSGVPLESLPTDLQEPLR